MVFLVSGAALAGGSRTLTINRSNLIEDITRFFCIRKKRYYDVSDFSHIKVGTGSYLRSGGLSHTETVFVAELVGKAGGGSIDMARYLPFSPSTKQDRVRFQEAVEAIGKLIDKEVVWNWR